ncbi:sugar porter family MFS transporter [Actinomadura oligospora]|uniref:sugar porter family MFS transporter n=1 Tax=Actinomadura oligospora TaxID=111804 RepID=UPI0004B63B22|nr:sugar porter family MFS transporter [Actinomadura oligospora]
MTREDRDTATSTSTAAHGHSAAVAVMLAGAAALGGFLFGYDSSVINGTVGALKAQFHLNSFWIGFVVSSALLGCAVGAWFAGPIADRVGRIKVMVGAAVIFVVSATGSALSLSAWDLTFWRVCGGLAIGTASVIAPAYIAEIAPANLRGRLGSLQQMAIVLGIFSALVVNYIIARVSVGGATGHVPWGGSAWRWMFAAATVPAILYGVLSLVIPESPRYLVKKRELGRARQVLRRVTGRSDVDVKIGEIVRSIASDRPVHLHDLRGNRFGLLPIVWVGIMLSVFQQFVGINVIFYYGTTLWQAAGFGENDAMLTSVINSLVNVGSTLVAIALVDRIGRRPLLLFGAALMAVTLGTMAVCFATAPVVDGNPKLGDVAGPIALVAANLYVFGFASTWGPVVWVMLGEMFNNFIRASALAVAAAAQWIANWLITVTFPALSALSLGVAYGLYTLFAVLAFMFVWRSVPETKGRELEDMDKLQSPTRRARPSTT